MTANRGEPDASHRPQIDRNTTFLTRTGLTEALAELRRLTQDPFFDGLERVLADLGQAPTESNVGVDTVRKLRHWSAGHQRVAIELEAAARCCRLIEQEISQRVDELLASRKEEPPVAFEQFADAPSANISPRTSLANRFREIFRRSADSRRPAEPAEPIAGEQTAPAPALSVTSVGRYSAPIVATPIADVATWALGPLEVHVAGRRIPKWNSLKARAVFQYLLIHQDRPTRRDVLMELQWPNHSHTSARNNLNVALYSLRNTLDGLGPSAQPILYRDGCYFLNPELTWWVDRNEFLLAVDAARLARRTNRPRQIVNAYRRAIQLYRGPLFEDDAYGEWYLPEQRRLEELYVLALEHLAEIHFELGELSEAVRFGQLAVSSDPCCEPMHRMLMRCYASQHQQQLVSRQYRVCVTALNNELGVHPDEETVQLFRKLTCGQ
jgi:SARP family transcriptional regulator, regulator of embCAB operon